MTGRTIIFIVLFRTVFLLKIHSAKLPDLCHSRSYPLSYIQIATAEKAIAILYAFFVFCAMLFFEVHPFFTTIFCICDGGISSGTSRYLTSLRSDRTSGRSCLVAVEVAVPVSPAVQMAASPVPFLPVVVVRSTVLR